MPLAYWFDHITSYPEAIAFSAGALAVAAITVAVLQLVGWWFR